MDEGSTIGRPTLLGLLDVPSHNVTLRDTNILGKLHGSIATSSELQFH